MMEKIIRFIHKICRHSANLASLIMLAIFVLTILDIIGTKIRNPLTDAVEITGYLQSILIPAGAAAVLFKRLHIRVEVFTLRIPIRGRQIIDGIISIGLFVLFATVAWKYFEYGIEKHIRGEYSHSLKLPFYYVIYLSSIAFVPFCLANLSEILTNFFNKEGLKYDPD